MMLSQLLRKSLLTLPMTGKPRCGKVTRVKGHRTIQGVPMTRAFRPTIVFLLSIGLSLQAAAFTERDLKRLKSSLNCQNCELVAADLEVIVQKPQLYRQEAFSAEPILVSLESQAPDSLFCSLLYVYELICT